MARVALESCLPHRPPMLLLDTVDALDGRAIEATLTLPSEAPQVTEGSAPVAWALEILAQAAAVWITGRDEGSSFPKGRLIKASQFTAHVPVLPTQAALKIRVENLWASESGVCSFEGKLSCDGSVLAEAAFTLLVQ